MTNQHWDPWTYREDVARREGVTDDVDDVASDAAGRQTDLVGFTVEAVDGSIGKVDAATDEVGSSYLVVDTGPWIFGRKVMLPAGTVDRVDWVDEKVYVGRSKDEIKDSPELHDLGWDDADYRGQLGTYYGRYYGPTI